MADYMRSVSDPGLQQQILNAESQFRPQYDALALQQMQRFLTGYDGNPGALDQLQMSADAYARADASGRTISRTADIADVRNLGSQATDAFRAANPGLFDAVNAAKALQAGGYQTGGTAATQDFGAYVRNNPDLYNNWLNNTSKNTNLTLEQYGQQHYEQFGQNEGRELPWSGGSAGTSVAGPASPYAAFQSKALGSQPNFGQIAFNPAQASMLGGAPMASSMGMTSANIGPVQQAQGQGYQAGMVGPVERAQGQGYAASLLGGTPFAASQGYGAQMQGDAQRVNAGQVEAGALGQNLLGRAMGPEMGATGQALQGRAQELAKSTGQLTPDEIRNLQQATRQAYAARGTDMSSASVSAEALSRLTNERGRMVEDLGLASALNQAGLGEIGQNRAFAQGVQGADIARQQQNVGFDMQAQGANQAAQLQQLGANQAAANQAGMFGADAANRASMANQQAMMQYGLANQASMNQAGQFGANAYNQASAQNQQAGLQAQLANLQSFNQAGQFGAQAQNTASLANQQAAMQAALANQDGQNLASQFSADAFNRASMANQGMLGQYGLSNQAAQNQFGLANMQAGLDVQQANRNFAANRYDQQMQNLGILGQFGQSQLGADRGYALQLAGLQSSLASDPFQAVLGRPSQGGQAALGMNQYGAGMLGMQGPQLFDPNAGVNLALQNSANLGNYQAATYGARAGAQGAMMGGLFQGIGSALSCWVARECYGIENPKWMVFRHWMLHKSPKWFRNLYIKHGERFAAFIHNKPTLKAIIRRWMDSRIATLS